MRTREAGTGPATGGDSRRAGAVPFLRPATGREIPQLTGLRFLAAFWVLCHHASFLPGGQYGRWLEPVAPLVAAGPLGVDLFFVLSGFVLGRSYLERWHGAPGPRQALGYVWGRLARIWPLYLVVTAGFGLWCVLRATFGADGVVTWQASQPGLGPASWLAQLTMTQMWGSPGIEGVSFVLPTWSVSAEWLAYVAFPVLALVAWRLRGLPGPVLGAGAMLAAAPVAAVAVLGSGDWFWLVRIAGGFTAGVLTWLALRRVTVTAHVSRWAHRVVLAVLAEVVVVAYWASTAPSTADVPADTRMMLMVPLFPLLVGALAVTDGGMAGLLSAPWLQRGGRMSYALYLVHFPLMEIAVVAMTRFPALAPGTAAAALLVPHLVLASLLVAAVTSRWIEVPARVWMHRMDPSRRVGSARRDEVEPRRADGVRRTAGRRGGRSAARPAPAPAPTAPGTAPVPALAIR